MNPQLLRRHSTRLCVLTLCVLAMATAAAQFARAGWLPELAVHFRGQYLLGALALLFAFAVLRQRVLALAAVLVALPNAWYAGPQFLAAMVPASSASTAGAGVSLISLNLHYRNDQRGRVRDYLQRQQPDVLVLIELTPEWRSELRELIASYPFWMSLDRITPWGLGVFSKFPLAGARSTNLGVEGSVNVIATISLPSGDLQLVAAHLQSPGTPRRAALRNRQIEQLTELLEQLAADPGGGEPRRVLVGDLNVTPYSPHLQDLMKRTGMDLARPSGARLGTWPTWMPPLQVAIDHCLSDRTVTISRVALGPTVGSDHYPLEVTLH